MFTPFSMTPRDRFLAGIQNRCVDRTPAGCETPVANVEMMQINGPAYPYTHPDGATMARLLAAGAV